MKHELEAFIAERQRIYELKQKGAPKPWTADPILQKYKFCNIRREQDAVTIWVDENIRKPFAAHPNLWFMLCIARQINWPDTLSALIADRRAWPHGKNWDPSAMTKVMNGLGGKVYTGAYMLNCHWPNGWAGGRTKPDFTAHLVLGSVWAARKEVESQLHGTLAEACAALLPGHGWGTFMAAQVVADLKHTRYLKDATDWWSWAASGPGSRRGLNYVLGREYGAAWREDEWLGALTQLRKEVKTPVRLCAQDFQNCLCEFSKYWGFKQGDSRPRSKYNGA